MKRIFLFLLLISLPIFSFAKYCPTCFETFQAQTIRGQSQLLYRWILAVMNPENKLNYSDVKQLFDADVMMTMNGSRVAYGIPAVYHYFLVLRQHQSLQESKLQLLLVDGQHAAIQFQKITKHGGKKYHSFHILILEFKGHKVVDWSDISHEKLIE